jgi:hypothetical protein
MTRLVLPLSLLLVVALALGAGVAGASDRGAARRGAGWIARAVPAGSNGQAADAIVALRAAGRLGRASAARRARGLRAGAARYAGTAGATGKVVLGLAAAGANPRCAGRLDLLRRLQGFGRNGRYGRTIFDQTLGMLAMRALAAGPPPSTPAFLLRVRGRGGWSFLVTSGRDDVASTAMAIMALRAAGVPRTSGALRSALRWLRTQRAPSGGFAMGRRDRTEANATALAIQAARAMGSGDARARRALRTLQRSSGAFQFTRSDLGSRVLASNDAVVALSGRRLPVAAARHTPGRCV